ncbi:MULTISPECIES: hypothetical protein [unclassified Streptomyces]|uniref:hypothetical protein n=1 Tax=unclassified Streptomyces TaxID=2593676 RepID=UPI00403D508A
MTLLPDLPQNRALLDLLRQQGVLQERGAYVYEGWELHTHPDLVERLEDLAPRWPLLATSGVPMLAGKGIVAVVEGGTRGARSLRCVAHVGAPGTSLHVVMMRWSLRGTVLVVKVRKGSGWRPSRY